MLKKILLVITLGVFAALGSVRADTTPTTAGRVKGRIAAASVEGVVNAISKADGSTRRLHSGDMVSDQTQIVTAPNAKVILVFSNGATVDVAGDSTLDIEQFEQDPFAADIKFSDMKVEVTPSPVLGEHTDEVLSELGYGKEQIARLHEARAV